MEEKRTDPLQLMKIYSCFAWHSLDDIEGGVTAPVLDQAILVPRVMDRLGSNAHVQSVTKADHLNQEPFVSYKNARRAVEDAQGLDQVELWLQYQIQEPRFDDAEA